MSFLEDRTQGAPVQPAPRPAVAGAVQALLYGGGEGQLPSPARGKGGRPDSMRQRATAPFAQCDNLPAEAYPAPASFQLRKKQGSAVARVGGHGEGFNPAVYTANRVANAQTREESRAKMSVGSGNILAHTVQGARVAPQQPSGSAPDYYVP